MSRSGDTRHCHLGFKRKGRLVGDRGFWKDTKETIDSGMSLKKDARTGSMGERRGLIFPRIPFCVLFFKKNGVFFLLLACIIFSIKKKVGEGFKQHTPPLPRPRALSGFSVYLFSPVCSPVLLH